MGRKKILQKRMARLLAKREKLVERSNASTDVAEVRQINEELTELNEDIAEVQEEIDSIPDEEERGADPAPAGAPVTVPAGAQMRDISVKDALDRLVESIDKFYEE